jgi:cytidylate kinase
MAMTVIAMTREVGSLGTDVAAGLAAKLGLKIILAETVAETVAKRLGIEREVFLRYVEGAASLLERWRIDRQRLFDYTADEVLRLAQHGNVLIQGWGVATLLRDLPQVISVRIHASMDFRMRNRMRKLRTRSTKKVRAQIERHDAARARTMCAFFGAEKENPRVYDLVLDTEQQSIDDCVRAVVDLARSPRFRDATRAALAGKLSAARLSASFTDEVSPRMAPRDLPLAVVA